MTFDRSCIHVIRLMLIETTRSLYIIQKIQLAPNVGSSLDNICIFWQVFGKWSIVKY